jgi:hypothetical protein
LNRGVSGDGSVRGEEAEGTDLRGDVDLSDLLDVIEGLVGRDLAVDQVVEDGKTDRKVGREARVKEDLEKELLFVLFLPVVVGKRGTVTVDLTEPTKENRKFFTESLLVTETDVSLLKPLKLDPVVMNVMAVILKRGVLQESLETSRDSLSAFLGEERRVSDVADRKESWTEGRVDGGLLLELLHHVWHQSVPQLTQILIAPHFLDQISMIV